MIKSDSIKEIIPALMKAQKEFPAIIKASVNPYFKSKYADLNTVLEAVTPTLEANGLMIIQTMNHFNGNPVIETFLFHSSGEYLGGALSVDLPKKDPQAIGSCISYFRRYSLLGILNLAASDDDAESTVERKSKEIPADTVELNPDEPDANMRKNFWALAKKKGLEGGDLAEYFGGKQFASLTITELSSITTKLLTLPDKTKSKKKEEVKDDLTDSIEIPF